MSENSDTVILTRAEYEALIERIEDAEDNVFLDAAEAREEAIGKEKVRANYCRQNLSADSSTASILSGFGAPIAASAAMRSL
jgi:hypothetical protein